MEGLGGRPHSRAGRVRRIAAWLVAVPILAGGGLMGLRLDARSSMGDAGAIVSEVLAAPLPELVTGESGHARSGDVSIWYESLAPAGEPNGVVLLIMGMGDDALAWPRAFLDAFLARGYRVVRFDNRGVGLSDWDIAETPFSLDDMADDAIAVLDALRIDRAHIVGHSMGGMIAQHVALAHPDRALSLTVMASSADVTDDTMPGAPKSLQARLIWEWAKHFLRGGGERSLVTLKLAERRILMGRGATTIDVRGLAETVLYNVRKRRGYNLSAIRPHMNAIGRSGSRIEALRDLRMPTLVIHGTDDRAMPIAHGQRLASAIPGARTLWVEGMGHDIPDPQADAFAEAIVAMAE